MLKRYLFKYRHIIKYGAIGITGASIDYLIFSFLTIKLGLFYQIANAISVSCGISNNYVLNYYFNFKMREGFFKRFVQFYSVGIFGLLLNAILLYVFIDRFVLPVNITKLFVILIVITIQFLLNTNITFKDRPGK